MGLGSLDWWEILATQSHLEDFLKSHTWQNQTKQKWCVVGWNPVGIRLERSGLGRWAAQLPLASAADHLLETCDQISTHGTADTAVVHLDDVLLTTDSADSKVSEINLALSLHYLASCIQPYPTLTPTDRFRSHPSASVVKGPASMRLSSMPTSTPSQFTT